MTKRLFILILFLNIQVFHAQTLQDSIFKNVIKIEDKDVVKNGGCFLIDIPFEISPNPILIFNNVNTLPNKLFFKLQSFLPQQREIILISLNWDYYKNIAKSATAAGLRCAKPVASLKLYAIKRLSYSDVVVDSISVFQKLPELHFSVADVATDKRLTVYLQDCYGSSCCPRDPKWDIEEEIIQGIKKHEDDNNVKVTSGVYNFIVGKEGEQCNYYTLPSLTRLQKLNFIAEMEYITRVNKATKDIDYISKIYAPFLIKMNGLKKVEE